MMSDFNGIRLVEQVPDGETVYAVVFIKTSRYYVLQSEWERVSKLPDRETIERDMVLLRELIMKAEANDKPAADA